MQNQHTKHDSVQSMPDSWTHAPTHRLAEGGTYMVTAGTYQRQPFFDDPARLQLLHDALLGHAVQYGWQLEAWAVFANHYHFVAQSPEGAETGAQSLSSFLADFHQHTAAQVNRFDGERNRKVWHNFWETQLTFERSYCARLNYVHQNAVKHGVVAVASQYTWCSAAWFERTATRAQVSRIYRFKFDQIRVVDDF